MLNRLRHSTKPLWLIAAVRCLLPLREAVTVVTVNWNSLTMLRANVAAVRRYSPPGTRMIVVDNGSDDASRAWIDEQQDVRGVFLDSNYGHGPGLDHGFLRARTRSVVALDVDAMPISQAWLPMLLDALHGGATVAGVQGGVHRDLARTDLPEEWRDRPDFVHPCCLAMRLRRFVYRRHTFRKTRIDGRLADPAERIADREERLYFLEPTSVRGPGSLGQVHGGIVYHNAYGTRHRKEAMDLIDGVSAEDAAAAWDEAVARYLA